jgi:hypothetical protein
MQIFTVDIIVGIDPIIILVGVRLGVTILGAIVRGVTIHGGHLGA